MDLTRRAAMGATLALASLAVPAGARPVGSNDAGRPFEATTPDGLTLSGRSFGDPGRPEILLVHGLGQSRLSWERQTVGALTDRFRVVTFDLRGHGDSSKPDAEDAYAKAECWADDLHAVISAAGLSRPTLVGWSLGGLVVGHYLARHGQDRVAGVNLVDAVTRQAPELLTPLALDFAGRLGSEDLATRTDAISSFLAACFAHPPSQADFARMLVYNGMVPRSLQKGILRIGSAGLDGAFSKVLRLLVTYGEQDALTRPEMSRRVLALNPRARISSYPDVGHTPFYEEPQRFNGELAAFAS